MSIFDPIIVDDEIRAAAAARRESEAHLDAAVIKARRLGQSWADIGAAAGMIRQSANERWKNRMVVQGKSEATIRIELPADLRGPELSDAIRRTVLQRTGDAGAVSIGDINVTGSVVLDDQRRQHSVRVRLYFGGPHAGPEL